MSADIEVEAEVAGNEAPPNPPTDEVKPVIGAVHVDVAAALNRLVGSVVAPTPSTVETLTVIDLPPVVTAVAPVLSVLPSPPLPAPPATPLEGSMFLYALAVVRAVHWFVFTVRQIVDIQGSPRCDCTDPTCKVVGKHPRILWSKDATNDEGHVKRFWERFPNDGIGVATGEKSGVWVLDVDPRSDGHVSLAALEKQYGKLPKTITVRTGSNGLHVYFKYPGAGYRNTAGVLGKGLDTRGDGGYVVAPPSMHKSGRRYAWINGPADTALAEAPDWLLKLAKAASPKSGGARGRSEKPGLHVAPIPRSEAKALLEMMLEHPLIIWVTECPNDVDRETWRGIAQNLSCAVVDHADLIEEAAAAFHDLSEGYSGYSRPEAERLFRESVVSAQDVGPMSFVHMAQCGMPDKLATHGATNLIHAARLSLRERRGGGRASEAACDDDETLIDAFKLGALFDSDAAYADALRRPDILRALARLMKKDCAAFELVKHDLKKTGMKGPQIISLEKAVKAQRGKATPNGGRAPPTGLSPSPASGAATPPPQVGGTLLQRLSLPMINVYDRQLRNVETDARNALIKANIPPTVFRRSGTLVRISHEGASPEIRDYTPETFPLRLSEVADWIEDKTNYDVEEPEPEIEAVFPDRVVVSSVLGQPPIEMPDLEAVCCTPYLGIDGLLVTTPGYSALNKLFLVPDPTLVVPPVSPVPTAVEVADAAKLLQEEMCGDFPFVHQGDRAHNLGFRLLPFLRCINGPTPLHIFEAPVFASGKTLLGDCGSVVATGEAMSWRALPPQEEELVKAIFSALRAGTTFIAFDNAKGEVGGSALESALTSRFVSSRILGSHTEGTARNRAVWALSANNVTLSPDLVRRSVRIRIDAKLENPAEGRTFKHPAILEWVKSNRGMLVHALLTLIQNWVAKGSPRFSGSRKASFESWSDTVGGILEAAGISGFLDPATAMTTADPKRDEAREFIEAWFGVYQATPVLAKQLLDYVCAPPVKATAFGEAKPPQEVNFLSSVLGVGQVGSRVVRLGKWCHANLDRVYGDYMIVAGPPDTHAGSQRYMLMPKPTQQLVGTTASTATASTTAAAVATSTGAGHATPLQEPSVAGGGAAGAAAEPLPWMEPELFPMPTDEATVCSQGCCPAGGCGGSAGGCQRTPAPF